MIFFLIFTSLFAFAQEPIHWRNLLKLSEQHEFYKNNEIILSPKDSWQSLFSVIYVDSDLSFLKDCVFFKVPGEETGILKIKTVSAKVDCEDYLLSPGDKDFSGIKTLQYFISDSKLTVDISFKNYKIEKWIGSFQSAFQKPTPKMAISSAEYKSPKLILLAPQSNIKDLNKKKFLKKEGLCHNINENCEQVSVQTCDECEEGWYEVPNGCAIGPKYCGRLNCGQKGLPACRRGVRWQRKQEEFDCRTDSSFAYCSKGLTVQCDGGKAFCR
jgi:hypothetical protein